MAKSRSSYQCIDCGYKAPTFLGRCPMCGSYGSLHEVPEQGRAGKTRADFARHDARAISLDEIEIDEQPRLITGIGEFDRILGGGIVAGSVSLIGGEPGIGKSTLMLQIAQSLHEKGHKTLLVSGEESLRQIKLRAQRLNANGNRIHLLAETSLESVMDAINDGEYSIIIIDSVQSLRSDELESVPGSLAQVREVAYQAVEYAKHSAVPIFLIGHVTKEGMIAGPKVLEHLVDTVCYFEGERSRMYRVLRTVKNRFGPAFEIGVFEMKGSGLEEVTNPSRIFLQERAVAVSGSAIAAVIEGTRPLLIEIQALVATSQMAMPRRVATGIDQKRLLKVIAVLEKRIGLHLGDQDIYVNVTGGLRIDEPAVDLAIAIAIASSFRGIMIPPDIVAMGEIGLTGEVRSVPRALHRVNEAINLGFKAVMVPKGNLHELSHIKPVELSSIATLKQCIDKLF